MKIFSIKSALLAGVLTIMSGITIQAQVLPDVPCLEDYNGNPYKGVTFQFPHLQQVPPLSTSMPFNVLIGYIGYDSLAHYGHRKDLKNFLGSQTYNDTIKNAMKYIYEVTDYDPIKFAQYKMSPTQASNTNPYKMFIDEPEQALLERLRFVSPQPLLDRTLVSSGFIGHIVVNDTFTILNPMDGGKNHSAIISSTIVDTIKGKIIPTCHNFYPLQNKTQNDELLNTSSALPGSCLQFQYSLEWFDIDVLASKGGNIIKKGQPLQSYIKKGKEYIVCLNYIFICADSNNQYFTLSPRNFGSSIWTMYEVKDGIVDDPNNDFGFGTGLTTSQFKAALRSKIANLRNP